LKLLVEKFVIETRETPLFGIRSPRKSRFESQIRKLLYTAVHDLLKKVTILFPLSASVPISTDMWQRNFFDRTGEWGFRFAGRGAISDGS